MIKDLIKKHEEYQANCIPLIASENLTSPNVNRAVASDLNHRYAEGLPGKRHYPGRGIIDEIEIEAQERMKELFNVGFCDLRPLSGTQANLILYTAFTNPGDTIMRLATGKGGHISSGSRRLGGTAGSVRRLDAATFAFDEDEFNIDVDETKKIYDGLCKVGKTPKIALFGANVYLFPHPIHELSEYFGFETIVAHDIAHVGGLIAGGRFFSDPHRDLDVSTMSTHKTFFGPQHGAILANHIATFKSIQKAVFPANVSNHHLGNMAGVGIAAEEHLKYGKKYAQWVVGNAQVLAGALAEQGFKVVGEKKGYTRSHIVLLDVGDLGGARLKAI